VILKRSLLKLFKQDKRPVHTCPTLYQSIAQETDLLISTMLIRRVVNKPILSNYLQDTPTCINTGKVIKVRRFTDSNAEYHSNGDKQRQ